MQVLKSALRNVCNIDTHLWALLTSMFSQGYIVGELNEIPVHKMGDNGYHGPDNPGQRLAGLDDGPIRFCAVPVLA